jgi:hypothetical protein
MDIAVEAIRNSLSFLSAVLPALLYDIKAVRSAHHHLVVYCRLTIQAAVQAVAYVFHLSMEHQLPRVIPEMTQEEWMGVVLGHVIPTYLPSRQELCCSIPLNHNQQELVGLTACGSDCWVG